MVENLECLAQLLGPCPECGNGHLDPVFDGEVTNLLCRQCGACWHAELDWVRRVDPSTCAGCASRGVCLAPRLRCGGPPGG